MKTVIARDQGGTATGLCTATLEALG